MSKDYQNKSETLQMTVRVEAELFNRVIDNFHQGQRTTLFRNIFESLDELFANGKQMDVMNYIYKKKSLTLKPKED